jgi:hypothetical protein
MFSTACRRSRRLLLFAEELVELALLLLRELQVLLHGRLAEQADLAAGAVAGEAAEPAAEAPAAKARAREAPKAAAKARTRVAAKARAAEARTRRPAGEPRAAEARARRAAKPTAAEARGVTAGKAEAAATTAAEPECAARAVTESLQIALDASFLLLLAVELALAPGLRRRRRLWLRLGHEVLRGSCREHDRRPGPRLLGIHPEAKPAHAAEHQHAGNRHTGYHLQS